MNILTAAPVADPVTPEAVELPVAVPEWEAAVIIPLDMAEAPSVEAPAAAPAAPATPAAAPAAPAAAAAPAPLAPVAAALLTNLSAERKERKKRKIFLPSGTGGSCLGSKGSSV